MTLIQFEGEESINFKKSRDKDRTFNPLPVRIKVLGVGGAGCSIVSRIFSQNWKNISFMVCDSSVKTLASCGGMDRFLLGESVTKGWGTGGDREIAKKIAQEAEKDIRGLLDDVDLLFLVCSLSKGLGAGASPVFLKVAREKGLLTIGFFILPFGFEGKESVINSQEVLNDLWQLVDGAVVISNDTLLHPEKADFDNSSVSLTEVFSRVDEVFGVLLRSIENILYNPGLINIDFADLKSFLTKGRQVMITTAEGKGEESVDEVIEELFYSPFWGEIPFKRAKGVLLTIRSGKDFKLYQLERIILSLREKTGLFIPITFGVYLEKNLSDNITLTLMTSTRRELNLRPEKDQDYSRKDSVSGDYNQQDLDVPTFLRKQFNPT